MRTPKLKVAFAMALLVVLAGGASAKCGNSAIVINGLISGAIAGTSVSVQVTPDPNWEPQPPVSINEEGIVHATVYFDRTKSEGRFRDNCSRTPESVTVKLFKGGHVIDKATLCIRTDFKKRDRVDYEVRLPITLRSQ